MAEFGTIWRAAVAVLAVWRLSRLLFQDEAGDRASRPVRWKPENFLGNRVMDCLYWLHVWLSAQTALWIACGFAGVFVSWVAASGIARAVADHARRSASRRAAAGEGCGRDSGRDSGSGEMPAILQEVAQ